MVADRTMAEAVLGLGSNLGARRALLGAAIALLDDLPECRVLARSPLYETAPLGPPQPDYLNAAVRVRWDAGLEPLLAAAQRVESLLGRERGLRWGPRTVDIDVLEWSEGARRSALLEVPHRQLAARPFALAPLLDVAPQLVPRWGPALAKLGGAPPQAVPGWPRAVREGVFVCSEWTRDVSELASQLGDLIAGALTPGAAARAVLPFEGPSELRDEGGQSWLEAALAEARTASFAVRQVAVTAQRTGQLTGVLVGEHRPQTGAQAGRLAPAELAVDARASGERRARIHRNALDSGFEFAE